MVHFNEGCQQDAHKGLTQQALRGPTLLAKFMDEHCSLAGYGTV